MLFARFKSKFVQSSTINKARHDIPAIIENHIDDDFKSCINELGGKTFNGGIYRVLTYDQIPYATESITNVFPEVKNQILCFGYDWLGRYFAVDYTQEENGKPLVVLLEPGAGEMMEIPSPIIKFHDNILITHTNSALASNFFNQWQELEKVDIQYEQCVGYKVPLFLGGSDTVENLELIDLDVYITICGQLRNKVKDLPDGMTVKDIKINV